MERQGSYKKALEEQEGRIQEMERSITPGRGKQPAAAAY